MRFYGKNTFGNTTLCF